MHMHETLSLSGLWCSTLQEAGSGCVDNISGYKKHLNDTANGSNGACERCFGEGCEMVDAFVKRCGVRV